MMNSLISNLGLSTEEANKRLIKDGPNSLPSKNRRTLLVIALETLREPMFLLLLFASLIYLFVGELREGLSLFVFVNLIVVIKLYQEGKTERALEALRDLSSPRALAIRDGQLIYISGREVVRDDVILLKEGDRVPADGHLISANSLQIDESLLTGESVPVNKIATTLIKPTSQAGGDNQPFVYSGTLVVAGQGMFRVNATGVYTEMGRIGIELESIATEESPLHKQTTKLVKIFAIIGLLFCFLLIIIDGTMHGNWLKSTLLGIALLMSMIPEEFPVVLTIFPALGAWRLSSKKVLTRRISAIETLGSTSVLCVDKTGTITQNSMVVSQLWVNGSLYKNHTPAEKFPNSSYPLIEYAILASQLQASDPMEKAFHLLGKQHLSQTEYLHPNWELVHEYGLTAELPAMSQIWKIDNSDDDVYVIAAKGSPEAIMALCHLNEDTKQKIFSVLKDMAENGLRILAVAKGEFSGNNFPKSQHDLTLTFMGLLGLSDPLREEIPHAMHECHEAGVRVIMITGDYPLTAKAIGEQAGLSTNEILTGDQLRQLSDNELQSKIQSTNICARITPNQKYRIVKALKANNQIVAMTGDGVNDAPALKSAHVSIAMGNRGTDVAREASTLVLLDDNFASIVNAIRAGRRIFDNMQKSMAFILAVHIPIAGIALFPILFNLPPVFYPLHIALLELIIDPTCSIAFENEPAEKNLMHRPPRKYDDPILNIKTICSALLQGIGVLIVTLIMYVWALRVMSELEARTFTFISLIMSNLMLIYSNRSTMKSIFAFLTIPNKVLFGITIATILILLSTVYIPFFANILHFSPLNITLLLLSISSAVICVLWFEILKIIFRRL